MESDELDDDLDAVVREALAESEPTITDAQIDALLVDPTFARIAAGAVAPYAGVLTEKGLDGARRTLAQVFLADPRAAELLAQARTAGPRDATAVKATRAPRAARRRGRGGR